MSFPMTEDMADCVGSEADYKSGSTANGFNKTPVEAFTLAHAIGEANLISFHHCPHMPGACKMTKH